MFTVPTENSFESDGTLAWKGTTIVIAEIEAGGHVGLGYSYADRSAAGLIEETLKDELLGKDALDIPANHGALIHRVRNIGRPGVASYAIAALDIALWDLKARILGVSLTRLLGRARPGVQIYGSGGFTSYTQPQLEKQLYGWIKAGIPRVKMKIDGDIQTTLQRVRAARMAIGLAPELFVDANGAYSPRQALFLSERLNEHGVSWFEEPVSSDDLEGMAFVREHAPNEMDIAAGEYGNDAFYFDRFIRGKAVDVVQIDATRCLGVTGFLQVAALCRARNKPVSSHTAPQIHAHLGCSVAEVRHVEYFHDHVRIEAMLFDGVIRQKGGVLTPDADRPGMGLELKRADAKKFAA